MLKDRTVEVLRNRAQSLRIAALRAEDTCVQELMRARADEFERLVTLVTPVLSSDEQRVTH